MDSQQLYRYTANTTGQSNSYSQLNHTFSAEKALRILKSSTRSSPDSPLSSHFNSDTIISTPCNNSFELQSSAENHFSGMSPSYTSPSFEANGFYYQQSSSSSDCPRDSSSLVSNISYGPQTIKHALMELETALMDEDEGEEATARPASFYLGENTQAQVPFQQSMVWNQTTQGADIKMSQQLSSSSSSPGPIRPRKSESQSVQIPGPKQEPLYHGDPSGNLKQLLVECARALSENQLGEFDRLTEEARLLVSVSGEPIQRLGAYMLEGLVARKVFSGKNIYQALRCKEPLGKDLLTYMHILYDVCPYLKFGYMAANGAIAEACRTEDRIHIIDFQIAQGTQWMTLLQALAARPGGPPHVRITGIDDPASKYARGDSLELVGKRLAAVSAKFNIPVEFHAVPVFAPDVTREMLDVRPGEAVAVNFPLTLHHTPDESVDVTNPRDELLRMIKSLSPKVTTLVEQESNTNTTPFLTRFIEALDYYSAMFESIDVTMPRDKKERINVEQHCLAKDIVNVIACEGRDRVERHELLGKWKSRFTMAGFRPYPLSPYVNSVIRGLLRCYSENYTLVEKDEAMLLGWKSRMLVSASAWH